MKTNKISYLLALLVAVLSSIQSIAQFDPQFTQYMFNELYINPAYAGSRDNLSGTGLIREQWVGLDGAPSTQTLTVHAPFADRKVGAGISILHETIGVSKKLGVNLAGSYRIPMDKNTLSFGLQLGIANLSENLQALDLTTDNQFQRNTGNKTAPNFGFGVYYQTPKWYAGLSVPRMLKNKLDVSSASTQVQNTLQASDFHYFLTGGSVHAISSTVKLRPAVMMKVVNGAPIELDLSCNALFRDFIWAGLAYRTGDAASLLLGAQLTQQFRIGYAYDYTLSQLQDFNTGSHELMLGFDFGFDKDRIVTPRYF